MLGYHGSIVIGLPVVVVRHRRRRAVTTGRSICYAESMIEE